MDRVGAWRYRVWAPGIGRPSYGFAGTVSDTIDQIGQYQDAGIQVLKNIDRHDEETGELFVSDIVPRLGMFPRRTINPSQSVGPPGEGYPCRPSSVPRASVFIFGAMNRANALNLKPKSGGWPCLSGRIASTIQP